MKKLAFKTRLHVNNKQETELKIYLDTARVAYNFGVGQFQEKFPTTHHNSQLYR